MAKYIFFVLPEHGHVNPTLAVAHELVARGEQVIYYLTDEFKTVVEEIGATWRPCSFQLERREVNRQAHQERDEDQAGVPLFFLQFMSLLVDAIPDVLQQIAEDVRAEQPDVIAYEYFTLWGKALAHMLGVPAMRFFASYAVSEHFNLFDITPPDPAKQAVIAATEERLRAIHTRWPLPATSLRDLVVYAEPLNIVFLPRVFQFGHENLDQRFLFVGPSLLPAPATGNFPLEYLVGRKNLYISLGTVFNEQPTFFQTCIEAFRDTSWQLVITTGRRAFAITPESLPENVIITEYAPQKAILQQTRVFITHGGMNSAMEALAYGVPLVVIPQMTEQATTAEQIAQFGLGLRLDMEHVTPERLRAAVEEVSEAPHYRKALQEMRALIREAGGATAAATAIIAYSRELQTAPMN